MAQPVVLTGKGKGAPPWGFCKNVPNQLFPNSVSTVFGETLFEAEHRGLEGPAPGKGVDLFFFFDKFWL